MIDEVLQTGNRCLEDAEAHIEAFRPSAKKAGLERGQGKRADGIAHAVAVEPTHALLDSVRGKREVVVQQDHPRPLQIQTVLGSPIANEHPARRIAEEAQPNVALLLMPFDDRADLAS